MAGDGHARSLCRTLGEEGDSLPFSQLDATVSEGQVRPGHGLQVDLTARVEMPIERAFGSALPFARRAMPDVDARSDASSDASEGEWIAAVVAAERVDALVDALRAVAVEHESANQNAAESAPNANEGAVRARARSTRRPTRVCPDVKDGSLTAATSSW